jgi:hypothetical protein
VTYYCALPPGFHEEPDGTGDRLKGSNGFKRIETKNGDDFLLDINQIQSDEFSFHSLTLWRSEILNTIY